MISKDKLKHFLKQGLNILPVGNNKIPQVKGWKVYQNKMINLDDVGDFEAVAIITGKISGNAELIDIDQKNCLNKDIRERYKQMVESFQPGLWGKLVECKTKNGGYHLFYRCSEIGSNVKLCSRMATNEELDTTQEKQKVLIETRSEGGYFLCYPSEGYEVIQGKLLSPPTITKEEREVLMNAARALDEVPSPLWEPKIKPTFNSDGIPPWESYDDEDHWLQLMQSHGWSVFKETDTKVFLKRPGDSSSKYSGNFDRNYRLLRVFSSSTEFDPNKSYSPSAIFAVLNCGGDFKQAARALKEMGYGRVPEKHLKTRDEEIDLTIEDDFISGKEDDDMLELYAQGKIKPGLSTGFTRFDEFYRFKPGKFEIIGGAAGLGKSTFVWFMACLSNALHGWKWIIYSCENEAWEIKKDIAEFLVGENYQKIPQNHRKKIIDYINENFKIIETKERESYRTVLNYAEKLLKKGKYDALMMDPYNKLKIDFSEIDRKLSTYEYHYEVSGILKEWAGKNKCSVYLNMHGNSTANRRVHQTGDLKGHRMPYEASDLENGSMWENAADSLTMIHRYKYHEELKTQTQIAIKKMRSQYSGGTETPLEHPVVLKMGRGSNRNFYSFYDENNFSPLDGWFKKHILGEQEETKELTDTEKLNQFEQQAVAELAYSRGATFRNVSLEDDEPPF